MGTSRVVTGVHVCAYVTWAPTLRRSDWASPTYSPSAQHRTFRRLRRIARPAPVTLLGMARAPMGSARWCSLSGKRAIGPGLRWSVRRRQSYAQHNTSLGAAPAPSCNGLIFRFRRKRRRTEVRCARADLSLFTTKTVLLCESQYTPSGSVMPIMKTGSCCTRLPLALISARWTPCVL